MACHLWGDNGGNVASCLQKKTAGVSNGDLKAGASWVGHEWGTKREQFHCCLLMTKNKGKNNTVKKETAHRIKQ